MIRRAPLNRSNLGRRVRTSDGRSYASKWERDGMALLRLQEKAGEVTILGEQVTFSLMLDGSVAFLRCNALKENEKRSGVLVESYRADVVFVDVRRQVEIVGDFKAGLLTTDFRRKRKWMAALGRPVQEIHKGARR